MTAPAALAGLLARLPFRRARPAPQPAPAAPRPGPDLRDVPEGGALPAEEWLHAHEVGIVPFDREGAARLLAASLGPRWSGPASAPVPARIALARLLSPGSGPAAVAALIDGEPAQAAALADAALSAPGASAALADCARAHGHVGTVLCAAFARACAEGPVRVSDLAFLRALDRPAWFAFLAMSGRPAEAECWALLAHYAEEAAARRPLPARVDPVLDRVAGRVAQASDRFGAEADGREDDGGP